MTAHFLNLVPHALHFEPRGWRFCLTQDLMPSVSPIVTLLPTRYGEKRMRIDARVMAWRPAPQKDGISGIPASIRPSKKWHPMTRRDAHIDAMEDAL